MIQNSTQDTYPKKMKALIQEDIYIHMFIAALFTIAKIWGQHKFPSTHKEVCKTQLTI